MPIYCSDPLFMFEFFKQLQFVYDKPIALPFQRSKQLEKLGCDQHHIFPFTESFWECQEFNRNSYYVYVVRGSLLEDYEKKLLTIFIENQEVLTCN